MPANRSPHRTRIHRVADQIRRELSDLLGHKVADPRLNGGLINDVEISKDLAYARVFVIVPAGGDKAAMIEGLEAAAGFLRRELAQRIRLRVVPKLTFTIDDTMEQAARIESLLSEAGMGGARSGSSVEEGRVEGTLGEENTP
ncbi:MAG: 30S ribosome-binding factor RbfA [Gammaproteobacteria bacterium]|nr:30S ribosome-binding factor RbfA [Gammaproteobacteria bacterium]